MRKMDKMREKGFDLKKPTIKEHLDINGIIPKFECLTEEQTKFMLMLEIQPNTLDLIWDDQMFQDEWLVQVFTKRISVFGLEEIVNPKLIVYALIVFGIDNPGKGNIFLIRLLEWYYKNGSVASTEDLAMGIFPDGFYTDETCVKIIDCCLKPKATIFSELY